MRWLVSAATLVALVGVPHSSSAQIEPFNFKFNSGQSVQPIFEGWSKNSDGSFAMHFGYLNRNYVEEMFVPVGPEDSIEPGGPDRGQPTFFYTRTQRNAFTATVPKDWGKKELVWTLNTHGKTEKAIGWLQPEWEVNADNRTTGDNPNKPPTIAVDAVPIVALPKTASLTAAVTDDGLPKPGAGRGRGRQAVGQETPPTLKAPDDIATAPVNVPDIRPPQRGAGGGGGGRGGPQGPSVSWIVWRGPASVTFAPVPSPVKDGKAVVTATFTKPGAYVLRARATDGQLSAVQDVKVTVTGSASATARH